MASIKDKDIKAAYKEILKLCKKLGKQEPGKEKSYMQVADYIKNFQKMLEKGNVSDVSQILYLNELRDMLATLKLNYGRTGIDELYSKCEGFIRNGITLLYPKIRDDWVMVIADIKLLLLEKFPETDYEYSETNLSQENIASLVENVVNNKKDVVMTEEFKNSLSELSNKEAMNDILKKVNKDFSMLRKRFEPDFGCDVFGRPGEPSRIYVVRAHGKFYLIYAIEGKSDIHRTNNFKRRIRDIANEYKK